jgi:hypothetical protein
MPRRLCQAIYVQRGNHVCSPAEWPRADFLCLQMIFLLWQEWQYISPIVAHAFYRIRLFDSACTDDPDQDYAYEWNEKPVNMSDQHSLL